MKTIYSIERKMVRNVHITINETVEIAADSEEDARAAAKRGEGDVVDYDEIEGAFEYQQKDIEFCDIKSIEVAPFLTVITK